MDVVIGFGMAGIGAFFADNNLVIYEERKSAGGLCGGFSVNDFYFDNAVHLSFTNDTLVKRIFDETDYFVHRPEAKSFVEDRWLKHPAQNNLFPCEVIDKIEAIKSFINREEVDIINDFATWTKSQYGDWLYENMFKPYNEKYWCTDLAELGTNWIENRIYMPTIDEVLYGCFTSETPNTYYAKEMRYPQKGKYLSFVNSIIGDAEKNNRVNYNHEVRSIDVKKRRILFQNGSEISYDRLFSSIPMDNMANIVEAMPYTLKENARKLEHTGMVLVSICFNRVIEFDTMWCYFYDRDIMAARAYLPHIKSRANVPENSSSIQFEIYYNSKTLAPDKKSCFDNCLYALDKAHIAKKSDIIRMDYRDIPYANVIFKKDTEKISSDIGSWLTENGINPIGRFGEWKYYWSDQAFLSGYNAVNLSVIEN